MIMARPIIPHIHHGARLLRHSRPRRLIGVRLSSTSSIRSVFEVSEEVKHGIATLQPIVALETTIYTHGFPYPDNVTLALDLEDIVRKNGAIPATIGVVDGIARVGLSTKDIVRLASAAGKPETMKVSRRDLPYILGMSLVDKRLNGGTTVSGTMYLAKKAGIKVFGTGGLGGVHRGGQDTMDVSADLTELGRTDVAVVSSGCKSFLDIPRTLEYLETQGCMVATFADGRTGNIDFPAFYTRDSGIPSPMVIQNAREAAAIIFAQKSIGWTSRSGLLLANPIPEEYSIAKVDMDEAINQAIQDAADQGIHGHANTPFILARIKDLTKGLSLPANRALIESNVAMAAKVAVELSKFNIESNEATKTNVQKSSITVSPPGLPRKIAGKQNEVTPTKVGSQIQSKVKAIENVKEDTASVNPDIAVFGSVALDLACDYVSNFGKGGLQDLKNISKDILTPQMNTSNIASITPSVGGVGHNVALAAHRVSGDQHVKLFSVVADDITGKTILAGMEVETLDTSGIHVLPSVPQNPGTTVLPISRTAQYVAVNDAKKDLVVAMADMSIFKNRSYYPANDLGKISQKFKWVVIDANGDCYQTRKLIESIRRSKIKIAYEPVSVPKAGSIFIPESADSHKSPLTVYPQHKIDIATPNQYELAAMFTAANEQGFFDSDPFWRVLDSFGIPSSGAREQFLHVTNSNIIDAGIPQQTIKLLPFIPTILTKLGEEGVLLTELLKRDDPRLTNPDEARYIISRCQNGNPEIGGVYMRLFPAVERVLDIVSVNGVGDTFLGVLVAGLARGIKLGKELITIAQKGAVMTLKSKEAVSENLGELNQELGGLVQASKEKLGPGVKIFRFNRGNGSELDEEAVK